jgi:carboxypeptidase family protein
MTLWETVRHQAAITGRVTDAQLIRPLGGARVRISAGPAAFMNWLAIHALQYEDTWATLTERPDQKKTAADGHFHFMDLPNGQYTLVASLPDTGNRYGTAQVQASVSRDANGHIAMAISDIALSPTTIKGKVTGPSAANIMMAKVQIQGSGEQTFSDSQGRYLLTGLETGARTVLVSAQGFQSSSRAVTLGSAGLVQTVDFTLTT